MKSKSSLLVGLIVATGCKDSSNGAKTLISNSKLADTLIGNWELVKVTGGASGRGYKVTKETKIIFKIFNQNEDLSFDYEVWGADILFSNVEVILRDPSIVWVDSQYKYIDIGWMHYSLLIYKKQQYKQKQRRLYMDLLPAAIDGYNFHFKKVSGKL